MHGYLPKLFEDTAKRFAGDARACVGHGEVHGCSVRTGVGCDGEFSQFIDASGGSDGFRQEYPGLRASIQLLPSDVEAHFDDEKDLI